MEEEITKWFKMAKDDLESAQSNFENKRFYVCAFLSQQTVEKVLKALLFKKNKKLIKIHDVFLLGKKVNLPQDMLKKCKLLSSVYLETRYGLTDKTPSQQFTHENSLEYLNIAKEIFLWAEKNI